MGQQQQQQEISRVTFAVLCYNYGRYLRRAIESCLIQKASGIQTEILVLDDGSTDAKYGGRIRVSRSENMGFGVTLTRAVQEANGEWIFFLDADDYFAPTKLAAFLPHFLPGRLFVSDLPRPVDQEGKPLAQEAEGVGGCTSTLAVFREAARDLLPVENELYFHVLARPGKNTKLDTPHTFYRIHETNMTNKHSAGVWNGYLASMTHRLADKLEAMSKAPPSWLGTPQEAQFLAWDYRSRAWYNELESALECHLPARAWGRWFRMVIAAYRSGKGLTKFHCKMLVKTILQEPSFPK
jgi:glycosyltransferase involved in cell wall biosynthesis